MATEKRIKHTTKNVFWNEILVVTITFLPFCIRTAMIRSMGMEYVGINSLFVSIITVLSISELGIGEALAFFMFKPASQNDDEKMSSLLSLFNSLYKAIAAIIVLFGICVIPFLKQLIKGTYPDDINIYIVFVLYILQTANGYFFAPYAAYAFLANQQSDIRHKISTVVWFISYSIQLVAILILKNYYIYAFVLVLVQCTINILLKKEMNRFYPCYKIKKVSKKDFSKDFIKEFKEKILGVSISKIRTSFRNSFDTLVISAYLGITSVAVYNNYIMVCAVPSLFIQGFCEGILPSLGNGIAEECKESNYEVKKLLSFVIHAISTVMASCMIIFYQPFMELWAGKENVASMKIAVLFTILFYIYSIEKSNNLIKSTSGVWWEGRWVSIVEMVVNLLLNIILVQRFGMEGVAFATVISMIFINIPFETYFLYKYYFKVKPWKDLFIMFLDSLVAVLAVSISYFLSRLFEGNFLTTCIVWCCIAVFVPSIILIACHMFDKRLKGILSIIKQILFKKFKAT